MIFDTKGMFCLQLCNFTSTLNFLNAKYSLSRPNIPSFSDKGGAMLLPCERQPASAHGLVPSRLSKGSWSFSKPKYIGPSKVQLLPALSSEQVLSSTTSNSCSVSASLLSCRISTAKLQGFAEVVCSGKNTGFGVRQPWALIPLLPLINYVQVPHHPHLGFHSWE